MLKPGQSVNVVFFSKVVSGRLGRAIAEDRWTAYVRAFKKDILCIINVRQVIPLRSYKDGDNDTYVDVGGGDAGRVYIQTFLRRVARSR